MFGKNSSTVMQEADAVLIVGTYVFPEVFPYLDQVKIFQPGANIIHIDLNAYEIGKNFPVTLGLVSDPKLTLAALNQQVGSVMSDGKKQSARSRLDKNAAAKQAARAAQLEADDAVRDEVPLQTSRFMAELAAQLTEDPIVFDEALTSSPPLTRYIQPEKPGHFFQTRGGSLGVGIPGALGLQVAHPDKTVIGFTGDGGSMYTIQALWTAARHNIPAKIVICNNQSYMLLKLNIMQYWKEQVNEPVRDFPESFDLDRPVIDFAALARSMGVEARCVDHPDQVAPAIEAMLAHDGPFLIDMVVTSQLPDASSGK
jgi:benzoylformate decarboxylase